MFAVIASFRLPRPTSTPGRVDPALHPGGRAVRARRPRAAVRRRLHGPQLAARRAVHRPDPRGRAQGVRRREVRHRGAGHRAGARRGVHGAQPRGLLRALRRAPGHVDDPRHAARSRWSRTRSHRCCRSRSSPSSSSGSSISARLSSFTTIAQLRAPAALRGRVVSVLMMLIGALYPIGSVVQGAIADEIGLRATTAGAAILLGLLLLALAAAPARCGRRTRRHGHDRDRRPTRTAARSRETWRVVEPTTRRARRLSLELKYAAIAVASSPCFVVAPRGRTRSPASTTPSPTASTASPSFGSIGIFVIALVANAVDPHPDPVHAAAALGRARRRRACRACCCSASRPGLGAGHRRGRVVQGRRRARRPRRPPCPTVGCSAGSPATSTTGHGRRGGDLLRRARRRSPTARSWCRWRSCTTAMRRLAVPAVPRQALPQPPDRAAVLGPSRRGRPTTSRRRRAPTSRCSWRCCSWCWSATTPRRPGTAAAASLPRPPALDDRPRRRRPRC